MTARLDYKWNLRELMARQGMFQTTHLRPQLAERGIALSDSQVYRLVVDKPERLSVKTLVALIDILGCTMEELIEPVAAAQPQRKRAAAAADGVGVGEFRPKRAKIVTDRA
ncbi:DNA-binding transcriptional regulator, XRE family [Amycolatopsis tolypomycina]|uniref:DNA-binding transcriptional regulator, XRE family n=1 Tax=Amycolatopsis tolypomycina TaxID=208445 RepID=A0A1H5C996_9PSEU|nr:helix-turn-helix transcriptional regulator [Amycolatopsis tolypomycina]SED63061.1 DNA-binding transcriptional regulator, XRE family [Amycolatopsis tolypomycina]